MVITAVYEPAAMEAVSNNIIHLLNFNFHLLKFIIYHTTLNLHTCVHYAQYCMLGSQSTWQNQVSTFYMYIVRDYETILVKTEYRK